MRGNFPFPQFTFAALPLQEQPAEASDERKPSEEEEPVWVRREREAQQEKENGDLPFGLYLLLSSFVAIAAVRSRLNAPDTMDFQCTHCCSREGGCAQQSSE